MQKKLLITGASGFIGSFIVEEAINRNYNTFAGIRSSSSKAFLQNTDLKFVDLNYSSDESMDESLLKYVSEYGKFDYIIHNAGLTKAKKNEDYFTVNFDNTKRFVEALIRNNLVPEKFVFISSLASFGPGLTLDPISSKQEKNPLTAYGRSKLKAEEFLFSTTNFPFIIINPTAVYGPREKDAFLLIKTIAKGLEVYIGDKKQMLSFIHVHDLVQAIYIGLESEAINKNLIISDTKVYNPKLFNDTIKQALNKKTISFTIPKFILKTFTSIFESIGKIKGEVPILNNERLKEFEAFNWNVNCNEIVSLGFSPKYFLENGIPQTIEWYKENGWLKK